MFVRQMRGTWEYGLVHEVNGTSASYRSAANIANGERPAGFVWCVTLLNVHRQNDIAIKMKQAIRGAWCVRFTTLFRNKRNDRGMMMFLFNLSSVQRVLCVRHSHHPNAWMSFFFCSYIIRLHAVCVVMEMCHEDERLLASSQMRCAREPQPMCNTR